MRDAAFARSIGRDTNLALKADAGKPDEPGLYISRACVCFFANVP
jgi:hypothetical protein